ncbi:MAG: hypothetical protein ABGZ35_22040 [Planctomycetaceae bacterium]|jgi:hypothetical protein
MTRNVRASVPFCMLLSAVLSALPAAHATESGQQVISEAGRNGQFALIMFYRGNDAATGNMYGVLKSTLAARQDAVVVPVQVGDRTQQALVKQFDATRLPLPAVAVLAPNGAVCSVFPRQVTNKQLAASFVSRGQAKCLKALQEKKLVLLCVQPKASAAVPAGVQEFVQDKLFSNRTEIVMVSSSDPVEAKFLRQLRVSTDQPSQTVAFMAPPGVMLGTFDANVSLDVLAQKLAAAGKCCDDKNCRHHRATTGRRSTRR